MLKQSTKELLDLHRDRDAQSRSSHCACHNLGPSPLQAPSPLLPRSLVTSWPRSAAHATQWLPHLHAQPLPAFPGTPLSPLSRTPHGLGQLLRLHAMTAESACATSPHLTPRPPLALLPRSPHGLGQLLRVDSGHSVIQRLVDQHSAVLHVGVEVKACMGGFDARSAWGVRCGLRSTMFVRTRIHGTCSRRAMKVINLSLYGH